MELINVNKDGNRCIGGGTPTIIDESIYDNPVSVQCTNAVWWVGNKNTHGEIVGLGMVVDGVLTVYQDVNTYMYPTTYVNGVLNITVKNQTYSQLLLMYE